MPNDFWKNYSHIKEKTDPSGIHSRDNTEDILLPIKSFVRHDEKSFKRMLAIGTLAMMLIISSTDIDTRVRGALSGISFRDLRLVDVANADVPYLQAGYYSESGYSGNYAQGSYGGNYSQSSYSGPSQGSYGGNYSQSSYSGPSQGSYGGNYTQASYPSQASYGGSPAERLRITECSNGSMTLTTPEGRVTRIGPDGNVSVDGARIDSREGLRPGPGGNTQSSYQSSYQSGYRSLQSGYTNSYTSSYRSSYQSGYRSLQSGYTNSYTSSYRSGYSGGCFTADQIVMTQDGPVAIGDITAGTTVISYDIENSIFTTSKVGRVIAHTLKNEPHDYYMYPLLEVTVLESGKESMTRVTANHRYFDATSKTYRPIGEFAEGGILMTQTGTGSILSIEKIIGGEDYDDSQYQNVFNLHMSEGPSNYLVNGVIVHNAK